MIKPSLRWEIIITLTVAMMASSFLISLVAMNITRRSIVDQKIATTSTLISFFQHSVDSICYSDYTVFQNGKENWQLQRLVKLFTMEEEVTSIYVTDRDGHVVASNNPAMIGTTLLDEDLQTVVKTAEMLTRMPNDDNQGLFGAIAEKLIVSAPVFVRNEVVGALRMNLSLTGIEKVFGTSFRIIVFYIVFTSILIIVFGSYLLSRVVVRPLQKLVNATEAIGKGDFNHTYTDGGRDEVGQLSLAFNRMAGRINEHQKELKNKIESLEALNLELKQSQKEVIAGEKLALVGKLAAGVAHEIGNPLSAVLGYINLLQKKGAHSSEAADYLSRMERELLRINKTIRGLLDFSRLQKAEITTVDVRQVLDNSIALVAHQGSFRTINLITRFDQELWMVQGEENQFQQVILNLLLNASEAAADDGTVLVLADRMIRQDGCLLSCSPAATFQGIERLPHFGLLDTTVEWPEQLPFRNNHPVLRIVVADNGTGVAADYLPKIFDPFFTTKETGKGTGLGLAICTRIIESYGGMITARSEEGTGTAFMLLLPGKGRNHG